MGAPRINLLAIRKYRKEEAMMNPTRHAVRFIAEAEEARAFLYVHDGADLPEKFEAYPNTFPRTIPTGVYFKVGELNGETVYVRECTEPVLEVDRLELYG